MGRVCAAEAAERGEGNRFHLDAVGVVIGGDGAVQQVAASFAQGERRASGGAAVE